MAERQTRSPRTRRAERWKERRKRKGSPRCWYRRGPGLGMSAGRRFMWLLIESFSLDRAACFLLRSRDSLRSSLLLLLPSPPCCSLSRCCPPLSFALFPSGSIRPVDRTPRFQTVMVRFREREREREIASAGFSYRFRGIIAVTTIWRKEREHETRCEEFKIS